MHKGMHIAQCTFFPNIFSPDCEESGLLGGGWEAVGRGLGGGWEGVGRGLTALHYNCNSNGASNNIVTKLLKFPSYYP